MDELVEMLREQPLLTGLPTEVIREEIVPAVRRIAYKADTVLYNQGDPASFLFMVAEGELEALLADEGGIRRYNLLYPGEFCGDTALLTEEPQPVTMRTITPCTLLVMHGPTFLDFYESEESVRRQVALMEEEIDKRAHLSLTFEGRATDEVVIEIERRHWMALVREIFPVVTLMIIAWFALVGVAAYLLRGASDETQLNASFLGAGLWLIPLVYIAWEALDWWNDYFIVTDRRVIHVERVLLLMNERYEVPMNKIQNVSLAQANPVDKFFGYGKISISTAVVGRGTGTIIMDYIPNAELLAERIITEQNRAQFSSARMRKEEKRSEVRRALGMENEPTEPAPPREPPPPPRRREGPLRRLLAYIRPTMREQDGQTVTWRRHWFSILKRSFLAYLLLLIQLIALSWFAFSGRLSPGEDRVILVVATILLAANLGAILWLYDDWRNDRYILTHDAIVDIESLPLGFRKDVRRAQLDMIQDIQYRQSNPFLVWANIGDVVIQTAGAQGNFTFTFVSKPRDVQAEIAAALQRHQSQQAQKQVGQLREELIELIEVYDEVRREEDEKSARYGSRRRPRLAGEPAEATTRRQRPPSEATTRREPPASEAPTRQRPAPPPSAPTDPTL